MLYHPDPLQWLWGHLTSKSYAVPSRPTSVTLRSLDFEIFAVWPTSVPSLETHFSDSEVTWLRNLMLYHPDPLQWLWGHLTSKSYAVPSRPTSVTLRSLDFEILCCTIQTHFSDSEVTWLRNLMCTIQTHFSDSEVTWLRNLMLYHQTHFSDSEVTWLRNLMLYHPDPLQWLWGHLTSKSYAVPSRPTSVTLRSLDFEILCCTIQTHFSDSEVTWLRNFMLYHPDPLQWLWGHLTSKFYVYHQTHFSDSEVTWLRNLMLYHSDPLQWLWGHLTSKSYVYHQTHFSDSEVTWLRNFMSSTIQTHFSDSEVTWLRNLMLYHPDPLQWLWGHLSDLRVTEVGLNGTTQNFEVKWPQSHWSGSEWYNIKFRSQVTSESLKWVWMVQHKISKSSDLKVTEVGLDGTA